MSLRIKKILIYTLRLVYLIDVQIRCHIIDAATEF